MMHQFTDIKKIGCDTAHQLSDFLVIIKGKGQFLIMCENFRTHVILDFRSHHMSVITNVEFTVTVNRHQRKQSNGDVCCLMQNLCRLTVHKIVGHIPHDQRNDQGNRRRERCEKHVCPEHTHVRFIIGEHFFHGSTFFHKFRFSSA